MIIAHATDLSGDDDCAHRHAAALAAASGAELVSMYAGEPTGARPPTAELVARWGLPIAHSFRCVQCCDEPADTLIDAVARLTPDLLVLGTHARRGLSALFHGSVGEAVARNVGAHTLIVPNRVRGFVDPATGRLDLRHVLVPAGTPRDAELGTRAARALAAIARCGEPRIEVVHLDAPDPEAILAAAARVDAALVVMPTRDHDGVGDVVLGSHTERVIRLAERPVLVVHEVRAR